MVGEPFFEEFGPTGEVQLVTSTLVDFGPALIGDRIERKLVVRNDGRGSFRVDSVEEGGVYDPAFRYQFEPFALDVGERKELVFYFEPSAPGDREAELTLLVSDGSIDELSVQLKGRAVEGGCLLSPEDALSLGSVALGTSFTKQLRIRNTSNLDWDVTVGEISSELDPGAFKFSNFEPGDYTVAANGELLVSIEFTPTHLGEHKAFLHIPAPSMCQPSIMELGGIGVDSVLECEPRVLATDPETGAERWVCRLDFGFVNPNSEAVASTRFRNLGNTDISITGFELSQPPGKGEPFGLETTEESFVVPAGGGEVELSLSFAPTLLGLQLGRLYYLSDDAKTGEGEVELMGTGGGPDIEV
ncbi:MAG TPA: hypothetical protein DFS52_28705, partial [Myxococcales bacterium]|nr:hypothetical protein [Myxococcales bacterium]